MPWIVAIWVACIIWAYFEYSFRPIIFIAVPSVIFTVFGLPVFERKIYIKISNGELSIHSKNAILWRTLLKDIISIELEETKQLIPSVARKAILIRNAKNDSYFLTLDGMSFGGLSTYELIDELNEIRKVYA